MTPDLGWWGTLVGLLAIQAAALTLLGAAAEFRVRAPQARRALWQAVLLGVALIWVAEISGLSAKVKFSNWRKDSPTPLKTRLLPFPSVTEPPVLAERGSDTPDVVVSETLIEDEIPAEPIIMARSAPALPVAPVKWPGWIWLGGAAALLLRALVARVCLAWHRRGISDAGTDVHEIVSRLCRPLGLRRVGLQTWPGLRGPIAFGLWRPTVALPSDFDSRFTPEQREAMLAHELAHLAARDPFWLAMADLVIALAWWHPGVWWAGRRLRVAGESAADEASALVPCGPSALAESLLLFGRELATPALGRGLGVGGNGRGSDLRRRVMALLDHSGTWRRLPLVWRWSPRLVALGIAAMMAVVPVRAGFSGSVFTAMSQPRHAAPNHPDSTPGPSGKTGVPAPALALAASEQVDKASGTVVPTNSVSASLEGAETNKEFLRFFKPVGDGQRAQEQGLEVKKRLRRIRLKEISFDSVPLTNVLKKLTEESIKNDPEKIGVQFRIISTGGSPSSSTNHATSSIASSDIGGVLVKISPPLTNIILEDLLDAVCQVAEEPITYAIQDQAVAFLASPRSGAPWPTPLITRVLRLNLNTFTNALRRFSNTNQTSAARSSDLGGVGVAGVQHDSGVPIQRTKSNLNELARDYFTNIGVNLDPPKSIYVNDRAGSLLVHATESDVNAVRKAIEFLGAPEPGPQPAARQALAPESPVSHPAVTQDLLEVKKRLQRIRLKEVAFDYVPLTNVLKKLAEESIKNDPEKIGVQFRIISTGGSPSFSTNHATSSIASSDIGGVLIKINPPLTNIILGDLLDAICLIPEVPLTYVIQDRMVAFLPGSRSTPGLINRVIRVNPNAFIEALQRFLDLNQDTPAHTVNGDGGASADSGQPIPRTKLKPYELARAYFAAAGVKLDPPWSVYYNERAGAIMVHATESDIVAVENAIERLNLSEGRPDGSGPQQTAILLTRGLTISDPTNFVQGVTEVVRLVAAADLRGESGPTPGGEPPGGSLSAASDASPTLYRLHGDYFRSVGLNLDSPGFVLLNERNDIILVRGREDEIQRIHDFLVHRVFKSSDPGQLSMNASDHAALAKPVRGVETNLVIRKFKVSHASFVEGLRNLKSGGRFVVAGGDVTPARSANDKIRDYFGAFGVRLGLPKSVFFDDRKAKLLVRATAEDLNFIHAAVEFLGAPEPGTAPESPVSLPVVTLRVRFTELLEQSSGEIGLDWLFGLSSTSNPAPRAGSATDLLQATSLAHTENYRVDALRTEGESALLNEAQFQQLLHNLQQREGVDFLSAPTVKTFSGRKARIEIRDVKTIVSAAVATDASPTNKNQASINYLTDQVGVGPMFEVTPVAEGRAWRLTALAGLTEFLGYDKPKKGDDYVASTGGKPVRGGKPYPHFLVLEARASALVSPGQTLALRGPAYSVTNRVKGSLFHKAKAEVSRKRIYVFVTVERETAAANAARKVSPLAIEIAKASPFLSVGSKPVTVEEVRSLLATEIERDPDVKVQFRPDRAAPISELLKALQAAKEARIKIIPSLLVATGQN